MLVCACACTCVWPSEGEVDGAKALRERREERAWGRTQGASRTSERSTRLGSSHSSQGRRGWNTQKASPVLALDLFSVSLHASRGDLGTV